MAPAGLSAPCPLRKKLSNSAGGCLSPPGTGAMYCVASASGFEAGGNGPAPADARGPVPRNRVVSGSSPAGISGGSAPGPTGGMYCVAPSSAAGATGGRYCVAAAAPSAGTGGRYWVAPSGEAAGPCAPVAAAP